MGDFGNMHKKCTCFFSIFPNFCSKRRNRLTWETGADKINASGGNGPAEMILISDTSVLSFIRLSRRLSFGGFQRVFLRRI